jgi:predicted AlkP superfamily pyrophosphatase or phosphodiesterase
MITTQVISLKTKVMYIFLILCFLIGCGTNSSQSKLQSSPASPTGKKVIVIIVDSLLEEPLQLMIKQNKLPAFSFLQKNGWYTNRMISSFPTMSVAIDSTLLTGSYPDKHHIPALRWYDINERRIIHYGDGLVPTLKSGVKQVMTDGLFHLNNTHLSKNVLTIHEELARSGYSTASINGLVYRGSTMQTLTIPGPYQDIQTMGPSYFVLGSFHHYVQTNLKEQYVHFYGINNQVSVQHLVQLIQQHSLPSFTFVYLPDMDQEVHKYGRNLTESIVNVDKQLQSVFNSFGSWQEALRNQVFIIMGDSGISKMKATRKEAIIDLDHLFGSMRIAKLENIKPTDDLALAVNERMAYVYPLQEHIQEKAIIDLIKKDLRIDTISWKNGDWLSVMQGGTTKQLKFRPGTHYIDPYGQKWDIQGEVNVLDLKINKQKNLLLYGTYPDGLMNLYSAAHSHPGRFIIFTAKPGYEMKGADSPTHVGGGAHGSLHKIDSYIPMFVAGTEKRPKTLRLVDLKSFILSLVK